MLYIIGKLLTWRSQILCITIIQHIQVKITSSQTLDLKHAEIIKFADNHTCDSDISFGMS